MLPFASIVADAAPIAPEFTGGWFTLVIQGGSFVVLIAGGYMFYRYMVTHEGRTEARMDLQAQQHTANLNMIVADSKANRDAFSSALDKCRQDARERELELLRGNRESRETR
jgi:hypothetical protein